MEYKESEKPELKASFGEWKEIILSIAALANKERGTVVVGINDSGNPLYLSLVLAWITETLFLKVKKITRVGTPKGGHWEIIDRQMD